MDPPPFILLTFNWTFRLFQPFPKYNNYLHYIVIDTQDKEKATMTAKLWIRWLFDYFLLFKNFQPKRTKPRQGTLILYPFLKSCLKKRRNGAKNSWRCNLFMSHNKGWRTPLLFGASANGLTVIASALLWITWNTKLHGGTIKYSSCAPPKEYASKDYELVCNIKSKWVHIKIKQTQILNK